MVSKSLSKLSQNIVKRKGKDAPLHENSRDSRRLRTATVREDKIAKLAGNRKKQNNPMLERVSFFKTKADVQEEPFTADDMHTLINEYLARNEDEERQIKAHRRPNRPTSTKEDILLHHKAVEEKEYHTGFWIPDMLNRHNIDLLRNWNGLWTALGTLTFVRVSDDGSIRPSKFPPTGLS